MAEDAAGREIAGLWGPPAPGKLVGRGHGVGDFLEAYAWDVLERREGLLRVLAHLPPQVRNPRGQLFGGFTPTYVDFVAIHTWWAGREPRPGHPWLATLNMRVDYFAPIVTERFEIQGQVLHRSGSIAWIETHFLDPEGNRLAFAYTTLKSN
jgi:acyl-coenzyme A thioesterase PaaI-like protein